MAMGEQGVAGGDGRARCGRSPPGASEWARDFAVDAQNPVYDKVCSELGDGRKKSHWMWFVFPQIEGLGSSQLARKFAISSLSETVAYLAHPVLGPRLAECTRLVNLVEGRPIEQISRTSDRTRPRRSRTGNGGPA
jgi:uncharacterized protein (DUF1810 family)